MGNKIVTLVTTFLMLMVFVLMISFITTDIQANDTERLVSEFTETVRYNGYITLDQYTKLVSSIPYKNIKLNITHKVSNLPDQYNTSEYADKHGVMDMRFTSQILGTSESKGELLYKINDTVSVYSGTLLGETANSTTERIDGHIYKMRVGDEIQVDLVSFEKSFFDVVASMITGSTSFQNKIIASSSGVILNEKYSQVYA